MSLVLPEPRKLWGDNEDPAAALIAVTAAVLEDWFEGRFLRGADLKRVRVSATLGGDIDPNHLPQVVVRLEKLDWIPVEEGDIAAPIYGMEVSLAVDCICRDHKDWEAKAWALAHQVRLALVGLVPWVSLWASGPKLGGQLAAAETGRMIAGVVQSFEGRLIAHDEMPPLLVDPAAPGLRAPHGELEEVGYRMDLHHPANPAERTETPPAGAAPRPDGVHEIDHLINGKDPE